MVLNICTCIKRSSLDLMGNQDKYVYFMPAFSSVHL